MKKIDQTQYVQLFETARHLNINLWAIPSVTFLISGIVINFVVTDFGIEISYTSIFVILIGLFATIALLLSFEKHRNLQIKIYNYLKEYEKHKKLPQLKLFFEEEGFWLCSASQWMRLAILFLILGYISVVVFILINLKS